MLLVRLDVQICTEAIHHPAVRRVGYKRRTCITGVFLTPVVSKKDRTDGSITIQLR
jgi:hypothetical protein